VARGSQRLCGWATRLGEEVTEISPFEDQVVGEEVTKEVFWRSCELERNDENGVYWPPLLLFMWPDS
jgi:hypothetical protein